MKTASTFLTATLVFASCTPQDPPPEGSSSDPLAEAPASTPAETPPPLVLTESGVVVQPADPAGTIPTGFTLSFPEPVSPSESGPAPDELELLPGGVGAVRWISDRTMQVDAMEALPPETQVRLKVARLWTRRGFTEGPALDFRWKTPPFALLEARLERLEAGSAEVTLAFSGPVALRSVRKALKLRLGGRAPGGFGLRPTDDARTLRLDVKDRMIGDEGALRVRLAPGVPMAGRPGIEAPTAEFELEVGGPKRTVRILGAHLVEGSDGWTAQIVCTDEASGPAGIYVYLHGNYYETSPRCVLDEASVERHLRISGVEDLRVSATRGGFRVLNPIPRGSASVTIDVGARSVDGGTVRERFRTTWTVPQRTPRLDFAVAGRYLPRDRIDQIPVRALNVSRARLSIHRVPPENLTAWAGGDEHISERTSDPIASAVLDLPKAVDAVHRLPIDLSPYLSGDQGPLRGLFQVRLEEVPPEGERSAASAQLSVVVTDLDLVVKRAPGVVRAWVIDTHSLAPKSGVRVRLVQPSGTTRGECQARSDGRCVLHYASQGPGGVDLPEPFGIIAETDGDVAYLAFSELKTPARDLPDHGEEDGEAEAEASYRAALFTDRGVYRPGETAHVVAAMWTAARAGAPPAGLPVELRLIDPRGTERERAVLSTPTSGAVHRDYRFPPTAATGAYVVEVRVGGRFVARHRFAVEAFVPERMRVEVEPTKPLFVEESPQFRVEAAWLFGGSAAGSRVELSCLLRAERPRFPDFGDFVFGRRAPEGAQVRPLGEVTGTIGPDGVAALACPPLDPRARALGAARVEARVAVFEGEGGRATRGTSAAALIATPVQIGLSTDRDQIEVGRPVTVRGVVIGGEGQLLAKKTSVKVSLSRVEREQDWTFDPDTGRWTYREHHRLSTEQEVEVTTDGGRFEAVVVAGRRSGTYVIAARFGAASAEIERRGTGSSYYDWSYGERSTHMTPRPEAPTAVPIDLPAQIGVGEPVVAKVRIPYAGRALLSVEADEVIEEVWKDVSPGPLEFTFNLKRSVPTVYVTALVLRDPHADSAESFVPARGLGVAKAAVRPDALMLPLTMAAPKELRSSGRLDLAFELPGAEAGTELFVAVVDEGVLSLTNFKTPDPLSDLVGERRLGVTTYETVGWKLVLPAGGPGGKTGGDGESGEPGAAMPVKPVALWSGPVAVEDGAARVTFDVPEYRGTLRVMAAAISPRRVGRAEAKVQVRDPVVLEPTVPRTLEPRDQVEVPVRVTNVSGRPQALDVHLTAVPLGPAEGGLDADAKPELLIGIEPASSKLRLEDGASATVWFTVEGRSGAGAVRFEATTEFCPDEACRSREPTRASQTAVLRADRPRERFQRIERPTGPVEIGALLPPFIPGTETTRVVFTTNPYAEAGAHLVHLLDYPFGCAEQTSSRLRALFVMDRFVGVADEERRRARIKEGIERLLSMQTASGGFAFWPGGSEPSAWASPYVIDLLLDLESDGWPVPGEAKSRALRWAKEVAGRDPNDPSTPYLLYALAKAGQPEPALVKAAVERLARYPEYRRQEARLLLLAAQRRAGDRRADSELQEIASRPFAERDRYGYASARRQRALEVAVLAEAFGAAPWLESRVRELGSLLERSSASYTTQELAWAVTAIARYVSAPNELPKASLRDGGRVVAPDPGGTKATMSWTVLRASERPRLRLEFEPGDGPAPFLMLLSQGVSPDGAWKLGGEGLRITRRLVNARGEPIDRPLRLGERLYSLTEIENLRPTRLDDLAVVDPFPAGLEPDGLPSPDEAPSFVDARWAFEHADLRDDRIEAFGKLPARAKAQLVVPLRAVSAGARQAHPPVSAEGMYDPEVWARAASAPIEVRRP